MDSNDLCNRLGGNRECVICFAESVEHREFRVNLTKALVVDDQQSVDVFIHLLHAVEGLINLTVSLKAERNSDDTNSEDTKLFGDTCDDWCCTSACATSHTSGNKGHTSTIVKHVSNVLDALFGSLTGLLWLISSTQAFLAQLQMNRHRRVVEGLIVGIAEYERHVVNTLTVHVIDGITATTADSDHLDNAVLLFGCAEIENLNIVIVHRIYDLLFTFHLFLFNYSLAKLQDALLQFAPGAVLLANAGFFLLLTEFFLTFQTVFLFLLATTFLLCSLLLILRSDDTRRYLAWLTWCTGIGGSSSRFLLLTGTEQVAIGVKRLTRTVDVTFGQQTQHGVHHTVTCLYILIV